jgi:hypothetical protein
MSAANSFTAAPISIIAANEYRQRQRTAVEAVRTRRMLASQAEQHLRPWLAIACLCGADLPELVDPIGDWRVKDTLGHWNMTEMEARWLVGEDICPRRTWAPLLFKARNASFDRFVADGCEPNRAAAVALQRIALHLGHDLNGIHIPPYPAPAQPALERLREAEAA